MSRQYSNLKWKLLSPGVGWDVVERDTIRSDGHVTPDETRLYLTEDNGRKWRDITAPRNATRRIDQVFFLDRSHGWTISTDADSPMPPPEPDEARFYLLSTEDAGSTWRTLEIRRPSYKLMNGMVPTELFFSDPQHGWILWHWAFMHGTAEALLATTDGGRSWKLLPEPPGAGPLDFTSALDGWMIGDPQEKDGIGGPSDNTLWVTHNGGLQWNVVPLRIPTDSEIEGTYLAALRFKNAREGVVAASVQDSVGGATFRNVSCVTSDGGKTWHFSQFDAINGYPSIVDGHVFWTVHGRNADKTSLRKDDRVISYDLPATVSPYGKLGNVDFVDEATAWADYSNGRTGQFGQPVSEFLPSELLSTTDGGKTFQAVTPPAVR